MRVVIVGSGNVATALGRRIQKAGHEILQVVNHQADSAATLAAALGCAHTDFSGKLDTSADLYLLAIKDSALANINQFVHLGNRLVVHTAGSVTKDVLKEVSINYGVLYPLQSLRKEMEPGAEIPLLIDANSYESLTLLEDFAATISKQVQKATDEERLKLHVAAVIVSNFTNHLYTLAEDFCIREKVDFSTLIPLIKETANRLDGHSPADLQTGPAIRNDIVTLEKHLRTLDRHKQLKYLYLKLTESIMGR